MKSSHILEAALAASIALVLGGCGGGADSSTAASADADSVPPTAAASTQSFVEYQMGLQASDTIEPLKLQQLLPPIDDTAEPTPIG